VRRESTSTAPFRSTSCDNVKVDINAFARTFPACHRHSSRQEPDLPASPGVAG
jgi:hypothetical protein